MNDKNDVTITCNIIQPPELRQTTTGKSVCEVRVAINKSRKEGDAWVDLPSVYTDVTCWDTYAKRVAERSVGDKMLVEGALKLDEWEKDGQKRNKLSITAFKVRFLEKRASQSPSAGMGSGPAPYNGLAVDDVDDPLPF